MLLYHFEHNGPVEGLERRIPLVLSFNKKIENHRMGSTAANSVQRAGRRTDVSRVRKPRTSSVRWLKTVYIRKEELAPRY